MKDGFKLYVLRTYVKARDASDAIRKAKKTTFHDVYVSEEWKEKKHHQLSEAIGFDVQAPEEEDEEV
jgi:hypothetical protein